MPVPSEKSGDATARRWDEDLVDFVTPPETGPSAWREYCDSLTRDLLRRWAPATPCRRALKTDLFDEAAGDGLLTALQDVARTVVGIDLSSTAAVAAKQHGFERCVRSDVRRLPFDDGAFDLIMSNSTLDHLPDADAIDIAIAELRRITRPGGTAIITLDNPRCPTVAVRAILPQRLLRKTGLIPYEMGATLSLRALVRSAQRAGFEVHDQTTYMHVLRVTALRAAERATEPEDWVRRALRHERRASRITAPLTGHFVAVRAVRPEAER